MKYIEYNSKWIKSQPVCQNCGQEKSVKYHIKEDKSIKLCPKCAFYVDKALRDLRGDKDE